MSWKIHVAAGNLSFSAAHFITSEGTHEPLHGHNYGISAELTGVNLTADSYLLDFGLVKALLRGYIAEVNHRFLLPSGNPHLVIADHGTAWEITTRDGERFVFPAASVVALPIDNATAERLAEWFAHRLAADLRARAVRNVETITIGCSETEMQTAYFALRFTISA